MNKFITLTHDMIKDKSTTMNEKIIFAEIHSLSMLDAGCVASNNHFAESFGIERANVSRIITSLKNKGYIRVDIKKGSRNHERKITIIKMIFGYYQNDNKVVSKRQETKDNNTSNNIYSRVVNYLNSKAGTNYKSTSSKTKTLISARHNEGFTLEDFAYVIDIKCDEWKGTEFSKFLRPETLFGTKFENYRNQQQEIKKELEWR